MFYIIAIIAIIFAMPASAQSIKDQLVGTWRVVSCTSSVNPAICEKPNAISVYDASGHYVFINAPLGRPKASGKPPSASPAEEIKAIDQGFAANFGTWTYNETDKTITRHVEGSFFPNNEGNNLKESPLVSVTADELRFAGPNGEAVLRRVSK
jgi:Lipocalin-like domain